MSNIAWLTGTQADGQAGRWLLEKEKYVIGRREPADLVLPFRRISRQHAAIHQDELVHEGINPPSVSHHNLYVYAIINE